MPISIYNSLTRKKEPFQPLNPPQVNMYTCGVTVYDDCHIGHARSLYIFDVIRRYLKYRDYKVNFVRNITDIDDKIIKRANELEIEWSELVQRYIASYKRDLGLLGIREGILDKDKEEPRATGNIPEMVAYIKDLVDKGYAYVTDSGVYFSVRKFKDYGKLSGQGIDQMLSGARIEPNEDKQDPLDFALWKKSKPGEPSWPSMWGDGRPGWHIECSVMSQKFLKTDTLDIHAGGRDLIFPHHENEIAQSEALTGKPFAKYWIHHGLLTINGQKMAKSLGNFVTIKDFIAKYKIADFLKMFFLTTHYSHPIDYTEDKIEEAKRALDRIFILFKNIDKHLSMQKSYSSDKKNFEILGAEKRFIEAMDDDFNTPKALSVIFELVNMANKNIDDLDFIFSAKNTIKLFLVEIFGIYLPKILEALDLNPVIHMLGKYESIQDIIRERERLRKNNRFIEADQIRKELEDKGIILEDTKDGKTTWRKKL
ncbi:MAG: cysteine--tRNA ligase [Candidatus Omnitrophica bacterium]|nr:cysteine--tRNA ligase [Candidatus Omnitrophota bacterium]MBU4473102.1 cysteine--tRNA ligase [Candidatus Omnitrophota bacterium]MCG2706861.1 cysteine--tRNA ligase [Candidatus Omnitrophota bacterium]